MKKSTLAVCLVCLAMAACDTQKTADDTTVSSSDSTTKTTTVLDEKEEEWVPVDSATQMKAWQEYATPGEAHKLLAKWDGKWKAEMTMWMAIDGQPTTSTAQMTNKMVMGGRYQMSTYNGSFMGMPFEGMSIIGYDNYLKKYIGNWFDNMGTGLMRMEGTRDEASNSITFTGTMKNPANGKDCESKEVYTEVDANTLMIEMYGPDAKTGKEYKNMEIKLTRSK